MQECIIRFAKNYTRTKALFRGFNPAIGKARLEELKLHCQASVEQPKADTDFSLKQIAGAINPTVHGWLNYYGKFYPSQLRGLTNYVDQRLARWAKLKFKSLGGAKRNLGNSLNAFEAKILTYSHTGENLDPMMGRCELRGSRTVLRESEGEALSVYPLYFKFFTLP